MKRKAKIENQNQPGTKTKPDLEFRSVPKSNPESIPELSSVERLAGDADFYIALERRREIAARKSEIAKLEEEYTSLGISLNLALSEAGCRSVDLGDGSVLQSINGPGQLTEAMVKEMVNGLLRAGVQPSVLKPELEKIDQARRAAAWFSVKIIRKAGEEGER